MANQLTGKVYIRHGGKLIQSRAGATLRNPMGNTRMPQSGSEVHGFTEEVAVPEIECTVSHGADTSLKELWDITDATCTFECDSGPVYVLSSAWTAEINELKGGEGTFTLKIHAKKCTEQKAALS